MWAFAVIGGRVVKQILLTQLKQMTYFLNTPAVLHLVQSQMQSPTVCNNVEFLFGLCTSLYGFDDFKVEIACLRMLFWGTNALYSIGCGSLKFPVSVYLYEFSATLLTSSLASCISLYEHNGFKTEIGRCKNNQFAVSPSFRAGPGVITITSCNYYLTMTMLWLFINVHTDLHCEHIQLLF